MNLTIPPPIIALIAAFIMWVLHFAFPEADIFPSFIRYLAYLLVLAGITIELVTVVRFIRLKTTINPLKPERSKLLVTQGLFQYSRNPMYLGMLAVLLGFGLWLGNPISLFPLMGFVWYITEFQIKPEETILLQLFGDEYKAYQLRVRRWL